MSSSRISGTSAASCDSFTSTSADRALVRRRHVAIGLEDARHPRARDQHLGELQVERRQRQRLVVDDLDRGAAAAEHHHRTEGRVVGEPGDQLARLRPAHHRLHRHAGDARARLEPLGALEDVGRGLAHGRPRS